MHFWLKKPNLFSKHIAIASLRIMVTSEKIKNPNWCHMDNQVYKANTMSWGNHYNTESNTSVQNVRLQESTDATWVFGFYLLKMARDCFYKILNTMRTNVFH